MPDAVIADTSPIFYLHRVGCLGILESLYGGILIPGAVAIELDAGRRAGEDVPVIEQFSWISTKTPVLAGWSLLVPDLGHGEQR